MAAPIRGTNQPPFGLVAWKENGNAHKCDGVLIGDVQVLTVYECMPQAGTQISDSSFTLTGTNVQRKVVSSYPVPGTKFVVLKLPSPGVSGPYAVLSWFGEPQATISYNLRQELVLSQSLGFSGSWIDRSKCSFISDSLYCHVSLVLGRRLGVWGRLSLSICRSTWCLVLLVK